MSCGLDICYCQSNSIIYNILYCFNTSHITLYRRVGYWNNRMFHVSIHLMLLFIHLEATLWMTHTGFNTSHVTLYHARTAKQSAAFAGFNTSHVTLYHIIWIVWTTFPSCFNTSHVTLYLIPWKICVFVERVSIHLMLLFILFLEVNMEIKGMFQYISCYSLSSSCSRIWFLGGEFQYISCYSLSHWKSWM